MSTYLVRLTPQEPYFFGNEKCLTFDDGNPRGQMTNRYYIKSERTPLQTTLLGAMRYVFLKEKTYSLSNENVGSESFKIEKKNQDFGVIKKISPLFLLKGNERLVVTPFDHIKAKKKKDEQGKEIRYEMTTYTPFSYHNSENKPNIIRTADGEKWFTPDFDVKEGLTDSYVYVDGEAGKIVKSDEIFSYTTRVMINKTQDKKAFFKKDYVMLDKDYSFGFYLELADGTVIDKNRIKFNYGNSIDKIQTFVYLGQGKSLFSLTFEKDATNDIESKIKSLIGENKAYCFGDTLADNSIYKVAKFAAVDFRDYRAYETLGNGKVKKDNILYKLIKAGSVFISDNTSKIVCSHANCEQIGFNIMIK